MLKYLSSRKHMVKKIKISIFFAHTCFPIHSPNATPLLLTPTNCHTVLCSTLENKLISVSEKRSLQNKILTVLACI